MKQSTRTKAKLSTAVAAILCAPALFAAPSAADDAEARRSEIASLRAQVESMSVRLKELEAPETRGAAVTSPDKVSAKQAVSAASTEPFKFFGEARVRAESIEEDGMKRRDRDRLRARAGVIVRVTDSVQAGTRISTGGRDPRGSNATLTGESTKKDVDLDLAYVQWQLRSGVTMRAGKMIDPIWRPTHSPMMSAEVTPEGWAGNFGSGNGWFGGLARFWLEERPADADSSRYVAQLGYSATFSPGHQLRIATSYQDFSEVRFRKPFFDGVNSYGNSLLKDGSLAADFDVVSLAAQLDTHVFLQPFNLFADLARNIAADDHQGAASIGAAIGDSTVPRGWLVAYHYTWIQKDALFAQIVNAEFGSGNTDSRGHGMRISYGLAKNWTVGLTLGRNDVDVDVGRQHTFQRAQFDLHAKY